MNITKSCETRRPYFSVVIPTYNRSASISATLRSVIAQTFRDFECLIIDDGSDDVEELHRVVSSFNDGRFRIIERPNGGGGAARNTGIEQARGEYISFLDSDDLFLAEKLEIFYKEARSVDFDAAYSYAFVDRGIPGKRWIRPDRPIANEESVATYLFIANQFIQTSTIVMRTEVAQQIKFDPSLRKGQDLDFCLRADHAGVKFHMLEQPLIIWTDISEVGRTSRHAGAEAPIAWLDQHSSLMSKKEIIAYRATVLSYYQPKYRFPQVIYDLIRGVLISKVPTKVAARQLLRFSLPRGVYRSLVRALIKTSSRSKTHADTRY